MRRQTSQRNADADHQARVDYRGHFLLVRMTLSHLESGEAEAFWGEFAAWLFDRGLYLGVNASAAVVYAPHGHGPPTRVWRMLRRRLEASLGSRAQIAVHPMADELTTLASELAAVEAVRNAQSALMEVASTCGQDLDRLLVGFARRSAARSVPRG